MPSSTWKRLVQKKKVIFVLPTVNAYLLLTSLKVCDWSGHIFGASASSRSLTKKNENPPTRIGSARTHQTRAKFQGLTLKNDVDIWTFVRLSAKITAWHRNYLVLVCIRFHALDLPYYWSYAVSSSIFCAKLCTNMPWSTWERLIQKNKWVIFFFFIPVNANLLLTSLKVCDWSGHTFDASASPRSLTKKNWLCHPLPLFMAVSMIPNM